MENKSIINAYKNLSVAVIKKAMWDAKKTNSKEAKLFISNLKDSVYYDILESDGIRLDVIENITGVKIKD